MCSFSTERTKSSTPGTLHAQVSAPVSEDTDAELSSNEKVSQSEAEVNGEFLKSSEKEENLNYQSKCSSKDRELRMQKFQQKLRERLTKVNFWAIL